MEFAKSALHGIKIETEKKMKMECDKKEEVKNPINLENSIKQEGVDHLGTYSIKRTSTKLYSSYLDGNERCFYDKGEDAEEDGESLKIPTLPPTKMDEKSKIISTKKFADQNDEYLLSENTIAQVRRRRMTQKEVKEKTNFPCLWCQKAYTRKSGCIKHMKNVHPYSGDLQLEPQYTIPVPDVTCSSEDGHGKALAKDAEFIKYTTSSEQFADQNKLEIDNGSWNVSDASNLCKGSFSEISNDDSNTNNNKDDDLRGGGEKWQEINHERNTDYDSTFVTLIANPDKPVMFSGIDTQIQSITNKVIKLRMCPQEDYEDFSEVLQRDEGLSPASPIIQIEDFEDFFSNSCKEIWIRHNIFNWEKNETCHLRSYNNLRNSLSYIDIEGEMFEDYIKVCGHKSDKKEKENKGHGATSGSNMQGQRNERSDSNSNDEGYGQHDESPKATTCSLVHVAKPEEICHIKLYFSRKIEENQCPEAHEVSLHAVLDKKAKIAEFLEKELPECGREQAAERIRVALFHHQVYTPILGESTREDPRMVWEEASTFGSFSYGLLNQMRGFIKIPKRPPPLMLHCDRRKYFMIKLTTNSDRKTPDGLIYSHGDNIDPTSCQIFQNMPVQVPVLQVAPPVSASPIPVSYSHQTSLIAHFQPCSLPTNPDVNSIATSNIVLEDLPPGPSKVPHSVNLPTLNRKWEEDDSSGEETKRYSAEPYARKRRKKEEIKKGGGFQCDYCAKILTRTQTLREHIQKFHPEHAPESKETSKRKIIEKGKESSASCNFLPPNSTQQVESQANYQVFLDQICPPNPSLSNYNYTAEEQGVKMLSRTEDTQVGNVVQDWKGMPVIDTIGDMQQTMTMAHLSGLTYDIFDP